MSSDNGNDQTGVSPTTEAATSAEPTHGYTKRGRPIRSIGAVGAAADDSPEWVLRVSLGETLADRDACVGESYSVLRELIVDTCADLAEARAKADHWKRSLDAHAETDARVRRDANQQAAMYGIHSHNDAYRVLFGDTKIDYHRAISAVLVLLNANGVRAHDGDGTGMLAQAIVRLSSQAHVTMDDWATVRSFEDSRREDGSRLIRDKCRHDPRWAAVAAVIRADLAAEMVARAKDGE